MADERPMTADDITEAIEYLNRHKLVPKTSANQPADYVPPTDITEIDPLANVPSEAELGPTMDDKVRDAEHAAEALAMTLNAKQAGVVRDMIPYLGGVLKREYNPADIAKFVGVERTTAWRWLKRIDPALVAERRVSVNPDTIEDDTALAVFRDFAYNKLRRTELTTKYDLPDKTIQSLIARGREVHDRTVKAQHKHTKDAAG